MATYIHLRGETYQNHRRNGAGAKRMPAIGHPDYMHRRETGSFARHSCPKYETMSNLFMQIRPFSRVVADETEGGVFGMDFSTDGCILGAAMEKKSLNFFDPLTHQRIIVVKDAHSDCANAIKFLDNRVFASCSDDMTVKLWDMRNTKQCIRTFRGHKNWVKNVEYDSSNGLLLTSGFDGYVYGWNVNKFNDSLETDRVPVFYTPGLMRTKLTPDCTKMILSTQWGYLLVIHHLDVERCYEDLSTFKPNMYWLMLKSGAKFFNCEENLKHFKSKRNRVELILDFPSPNDPDNISSVTPHPYGWSVLSRNTNHDESSEWTCVHDIQLPPLDIDDEFSSNSTDQNVACPLSPPVLSLQQGGGEPLGGDTRVVSTSRTTTSSGRSIIAIEMLPITDDPNGSLDSNSGMIPASPGSNDTIMDDNSSRSSSGAGTNSDSSNSPTTQRNRRSSLNVVSEPRAIFLPQDPSNMHQRLVIILPSGTSGASATLSHSSSSSGSTAEMACLPKTYNRLVSYIQEPNVGRGYIKEQSFSPDGRLIASPYSFGVRLLAFSQDCRELCDSEMVDGRAASSMTSPPKLYETGTCISHGNVVLCAKFSPTHLLVASGCLNGNVSFYQPVL